MTHLAKYLKGSSRIKSFYFNTMSPLILEMN